MKLFRDEYKIHHREQWMLSRAKYRAKKLDLPFDLTTEDIQIPEVCPVLGIKLELNSGRQGYYANSASLDRLNPAAGYVHGNVRVISARANLLKNDATVTELEAVLEDLRRIRSNEACI